MSKHLVMSRSGHDVIEFDKANPAEVEEAMARFEALIKEGHTAATRKTGETDYTVIKDPNKQQDETLFVSPMQGG